VFAAASDGIWEVIDSKTFRIKYSMMIKQSICL